LARRRTIRHADGPATNCQTFVTSDGTTRSAAACTGGIVSPSAPIATVGRPMPTTPLDPASQEEDSDDHRYGLGRHLVMPNKTKLTGPPRRIHARLVAAVLGTELLDESELTR